MANKYNYRARKVCPECGRLDVHRGIKVKGWYCSSCGWRGRVPSVKMIPHHPIRGQAIRLGYGKAEGAV